MNGARTHPDAPSFGVAAGSRRQRLPRPKVDGVLFVIRASFTSARLSHNALGLVFNSIESNSREYYYFKQPEYYAHDKTAQK